MEILLGHNLFAAGHSRTASARPQPGAAAGYLETASARPQPGATAGYLALAGTAF